jgi:hypothetical protein
MPRAPRTCFGLYKILASSGDGIMGDAYRARNTRLNRSALTLMAMLAAPLLCLGQPIISVVAGTGNPPITPGAIGDGGQAKNAFLDGPESVTLDPEGNLYIRIVGHRPLALRTSHVYIGEWNHV